MRIPGLLGDLEDPKTFRRPWGSQDVSETLKIPRFLGDLEDPKILGDLEGLNIFPLVLRGFHCYCAVNDFHQSKAIKMFYRIFKLWNRYNNAKSWHVNDKPNCMSFIEVHFISSMPTQLSKYASLIDETLNGQSPWQINFYV